MGYLNQFFKPIPHILSYHIFRVQADKPGLVQLQEFSDLQMVEVNTFKTGVTKEKLIGLPQLTIVPGLT